MLKICKASDRFQDAVLRFAGLDVNAVVRGVPLTKFEVELKAFSYTVANTKISAKRLQELMRAPVRKPAYLMQAMQELQRELPDVAFTLTPVHYTSFGRYYA